MFGCEAIPVVAFVGIFVVDTEIALDVCKESKPVVNFEGETLDTC